MAGGGKTRGGSSGGWVWEQQAGGGVGDMDFCTSMHGVDSEQGMRQACGRSTTWGGGNERGAYGRGSTMANVGTLQNTFERQDEPGV